METRAHFVLIGTFTLSILVSAFLFVLWFAGSEIDHDFDEYDVVFDSAVTGLSEGGDVRYSGIKIGEVTRLSLNPESPSQVIARIKVTEDTPVYADSTARLEVQGLTGIAFILITNTDESNRELLKDVAEKSVPVLRGEPSALQELVMTAPGLIEGATNVLAQLQMILSDGNREKVNTILSDFQNLSSSLVDRSDQIGIMVDNFSTISTDLAGATHQLSELSSTANTLLQGDGQLLVKDTRAAVKSVRVLSDNANAMLENNSGAIQSFSQDGLAQLGPFLTDTRATMETLNRILQRMESDPARYLSGNYASEYETE